MVRLVHFHKNFVKRHFRLVKPWVDKENWHRKIVMLITRLNGSFDEVIGIYYGKKYFGEKAKADVTDMIHRMIKVYEERIQDNDWLSDETKKKAIVKLRALVFKIGYPDKIEKIYDLLQVDPQKSLYENEKAMGKWSWKVQFKQINWTGWSFRMANAR